jgi:hypothetical protein
MLDPLEIDADILRTLDHCAGGREDAERIAVGVEIERGKGQGAPKSGRDRVHRRTCSHNRQEIVQLTASRALSEE